MKRIKRIGCILMAMLLFAGIVAGCGSGGTKPEDTKAVTSAASSAGTDATVSEEIKAIEYTFLDTVHATAPFGYNNPNDVVTPWVEENLKVKVKEVVFAAGQAPMERINMMVAADNLPDVVLIDSPDVAAAYATGAFADLTDYIKNLPNIDKFVSDIGWNMNSVDGRVVAIPVSSMEVDSKNPEVEKMIGNDLYFRLPNNWAFVVQQDILKQLGYTFKTVDEVQAELDANPRRITDEDVAITPAIDTFEKFEKLLYDIKALKLKVDGKDLIPLSIPEWGMYHISTLFAQHGGFIFDEAASTTSAYLANPGMKEFYKVAGKWIKDGILDRDFMILKPEQYQERVSAGRVAVTFMIPDVAGTRQNLKAKSPTNDLRPIKWPAPVVASKSYVDPSYPGGFYVIMVNKKYENLERLLSYFDWFQTEEAMDIGTWGPESAGLFAVNDGKKQFKDEKLWEAIRDAKKTDDGRNAEYYGIYDKNNSVAYFTSKAFLSAPAPYINLKASERSYPTKFNAYGDMFNYVSTSKLCRDGSVLAPTGEKASALGSYYWGTTKSKVARLFDAKSDADFDKIYEELVNDMKVNGGYDEAVASMDPLFKGALGK